MNGKLNMKKMFKLEVCNTTLKNAYFKNQVFMEINKNVVYWKKGRFLK